MQRRHQKVVEYAPAWSLPPALRARLADDALKIARHVKLQQRRHGRVPGRRGRRALLHRGQPAHPGRAHGHRGDHRRAIWCRRRSGSRRATSCPIRRSASAARTTIQQRGVAIQVRVTAEDPRNDFLPDTGKITVYRPAVGLGIRLDDGSGYVGARVSPYYDSLLVEDHRQRARVELRPAQGDPRAARVPHPRREDQPRASSRTCSSHPTFAAGKAHTTFIDETPELMQYAARRDRATRILRYVGVDDRQRPPDRARQAEAAAVGAARRESAPPPVPRQPPPPGTKQVLEKRGAGGHREDAARAIRACAYTDTTWRDAHQSLLATRLRTLRHRARRARDGAPVRASCSRWRCGAARRSTSPTASCRRTRGCGWRSCAGWSRT